MSVRDCVCSLTSIAVFVRMSKQINPKINPKVNPAS